MILKEVYIFSARISISKAHRISWSFFFSTFRSGPRCFRITRAPADRQRSVKFSNLSKKSALTSHPKKRFYSLLDLILSKVPSNLRNSPLINKYRSSFMLIKLIIRLSFFRIIPNLLDRAQISMIKSQHILTDKDSRIQARVSHHQCRLNKVKVKTNRNSNLR